METQVAPPPVEDIAKALRKIVATGLPVSPSLTDETLLGLRGVVARSINRDDRLGRIKALDELLARLLVHYPDDTLGESARILFAIAPGYRGSNLTTRREAAAGAAEREVDHFRKRIEPEIITGVAWQLHRDSQNYIPRGRSVPPPLEASGDSPTIRAGDVANKEAAEHEELLSRLWAHVYALRAEILRVERLKNWPHDPTEPTTSEKVLVEAIAARDYEVDAVKVLIATYTERYGQRIAHGDAEFNTEALLRLAGWESGL
ncbi:hypothetical protein RR49_00313 [Microbacterium ginsengisoli]|uniref:Uncharacterized protein n=1 Tax=Microbacterium ginsengisoli TaxID=400772 RepID=A0A0F0LY35_9MICO|nr:hypothetical protein [Microbacterium ginsengisoli]KJL42015.1 hypothetical protein RR49_00313 [Microbacterium ginsengisoli]MBN9209583.1 hypothetical protein [Microbacterium ginsengisoli]